MSEPPAGIPNPYLVPLDRAGTRTPAHPVHPGVNLLSPEFWLDPHERLGWMREHAPVYWDDGVGLWGIALHADVMHVSKHAEDFCSGKGSRPESCVPSMINMDAPEHVRRRRIVSAGFTPRRVADHEPWLRRKVGALLDAAAAQGGCDFVREVARPLPMLVIGELMGLPEADHEQLLAWSDVLAAGGEELSLQAVAAFGEYAAYMSRVIASRRGGSGEDLVSLIVNAELGGEPLDDEALIHETLLILIGGDETTRHVISGGLEQLLRHPEQLKLLQRMPARIPLAVEEMLRWVTPIQNMNRSATRDLELGGQRIREGDRLLLLYPSANRDERVFAEPFRFDVTRDPNPHVAFGGFGRHHCLGAPLARLELRILFEELLARHPNLRLSDPETPPPRRPGNFVVGLESLGTFLP